MLYILNKPGLESLRQLALIGSADDEKAVLLVSDAVFLAGAAQVKRLAELGAEDIYAAEDALKARAVKADPSVEIADYGDMAALLEEHDKIVTL